jgi:hypothetical protein
MERSAMKLKVSLLNKIAMAAFLLGSISPNRVRGQESPAPTEPPVASVPEEISPTPTVSVSPVPTPATTRSVRISFLPPPLEGRISLGIYDANGQLVRVLHKEAPFSEFDVGADALITKWDGKDDSGNDRPSGKYHARGYLVGALKMEEPVASTDAAADASGTVQVKLMPNPLSKNAGAIVDLGAAFDDKNVFLKTADGLPLLTAARKTNLSRVWIRKNGEKAVDIFLDENGTIAQVRLSNVDKMMGFDCGDLELK